MPFSEIERPKCWCFLIFSVVWEKDAVLFSCQSTRNHLISRQPFLRVYIPYIPFLIRSIYSYVLYGLFLSSLRRYFFKNFSSVSTTMAQFTKTTKDRKIRNSKVPYHITDISFQTPATGLWKLKGHQTWVASTHARFFCITQCEMLKENQGQTKQNKISTTGR